MASVELPASSTASARGPAIGHELTLAGALEGLLFVAEGPVEAAQLAKALSLPEDVVGAALEELAAWYQSAGRGLRLQRLHDRYQLVTAPEAASLVEAFLNLDLSSRLSGPALETLAVIAYRQPVTRAQIEGVRGVDCAGILRSLQQRGLIDEVGRLDTVGRPILYGATELFMQHFGLTALDELPALEQPDADLLWAATTLAALEEAQTGQNAQRTGNAD